MRNTFCTLLLKNDYTNKTEHLFAMKMLLWYNHSEKMLVDSNHSGKYNIGKNHLINWCF